MDLFFLVCLLLLLFFFSKRFIRRVLNSCTDRQQHNEGSEESLGIDSIDRQQRGGGSERSHP